MLVVKEYNGFSCAPPVVFSFSQAMYYCSGGSGGGTPPTYQCSHPPDCSGRISQEDEYIAPPCTRNITACSPLSYMTACVYDKGPYDQDFLPEISYNVISGVHECSMQEYRKEFGSFQCWDKFQDQWCLGHLVPNVDLVPWPACPTVPLASCQHLESFGFVDLEYCYCTTELGLGSFACRPPRDAYRDDPERWLTDPPCFGTIDTLRGLRKMSSVFCLLPMWTSCPI